MSKNMSDKPFYKRRWFIVLLLIAGCFGDIKDRSDHGEDYEVTGTPNIVETSIPEEEIIEHEVPIEEEIKVIPKRKEDTSTSNIRKDVKAKIDEYEDFMEEYNVFMQTYDESSIYKTIEYDELEKMYYEMVDQIEALQDELTTEELEYYTEVLNRIDYLY